MRPRLPSSPAGLVVTALVGTILPAALFLTPKSVFHHGALATRLLIGVGFLVVGLALFLKSITELKEGVRNQRWTDAQLAPFRRVCESPVYTVGAVALLVAFAVLAIPSSAHSRSIGWTFYLFSQALLQLRNALLPPKLKSPGKLLDWSSVGLLSSDHWGER